MKKVPCFICGTLVEVTDERAIAKLCVEHDTPENRKKMLDTPVHQLLRILNDHLQKQVDEVTTGLTQTNSEYNTIREELKNLQQKIDGLKTPEPTQEEPRQQDTGGINEYGEVV